MQQLIIIRGYPGSGKTTLGKNLAVKGAGIFIDHNKILNCVTTFTENDKGLYKDIHDLEVAMASKLLHEGKSVIIARGFSPLSTFRPYVDIAEKLGVRCKVVRLDVPVQVLLERIKNPDRNDDAISIKTETSLKQWLADNPIENYSGERIIDGVQKADSVAEEVT